MKPTNDVPSRNKRHDRVIRFEGSRRKHPYEDDTQRKVNGSKSPSIVSMTKNFFSNFMNMFYDGRRGKEKAEEDLTTSKESNIKNDKKDATTEVQNFIQEKLKDLPEDEMKKIVNNLTSLIPDVKSGVEGDADNISKNVTTTHDIGNLIMDKDNKNMPPHNNNQYYPQRRISSSAFSSPSVYPPEPPYYGNHYPLTPREVSTPPHVGNTYSLTPYYRKTPYMPPRSREYPVYHHPSPWRHGEINYGEEYYGQRQGYGYPPMYGYDYDVVDQPPLPRGSEKKKRKFIVNRTEDFEEEEYEEAPLPTKKKIKLKKSTESGKLQPKIKLLKRRKSDVTKQETPTKASVESKADDSVEKKRLEEEKKQLEEKKRLEEEKKQQEEKKKLEEEKRRLELEKQKIDEERKRQEEETRLNKEREDRLREEAEKKKKEEEDRIKKEQELKRLLEQKKKEEEEEEERKRQEEIKRIEEQVKLEAEKKLKEQEEKKQLETKPEEKKPLFGFTAQPSFTKTEEVPSKPTTFGLQQQTPIFQKQPESEQPKDISNFGFKGVSTGGTTGISTGTTGTSTGGTSLFGLTTQSKPQFGAPPSNGTSESSGPNVPFGLSKPGGSLFGADSGEKKSLFGGQPTGTSSPFNIGSTPSLGSNTSTAPKLVTNTTFQFENPTQVNSTSQPSTRSKPYFFGGKK